MTQTAPVKKLDIATIELGKDLENAKNNKEIHDVEVTLNGKTYYSNKLIMSQW